MRHHAITLIIAALVSAELAGRPVFAMSGPPDWPDEDELPSTNVQAAATPGEEAFARLPGVAPYAIAGLAGTAAFAVWRIRKGKAGAGEIPGPKGKKGGHRNEGPES